MLNEKGSVSIEAAVSLVVTISAILTVSLFARVAYVQGVVQHALIQTANEMAAYSYFYSLTGLNQINGAIVEKKLAADEAGSDAVDKVSDAYDNVTKVFDEFTNGNYASVGSDLGEVKDSLGNLTKISITQTLKDFCISLAGEAVEEIKTNLCNLVTTPLLKTYLPSGDSFLRQGMFVDENGNYIEKNSAYFPIDLSYSSYFSNANADEICIIAVYDIKPVTPIPIFDKPITIAQTAKARAWLSNWQGGKVEETSSVWDLSSTERASKIASGNSALNLASNFKCIRGFDSGSGNASMFITIDIRSSSYTGNENAMKYKLQQKLTGSGGLSSFTSYGSVSVGDIKSVDYYVYIPEDASSQDKSLLKSAARNLGSTIKLSDGRTVRLNIIVKEEA